MVDPVERLESWLDEGRRTGAPWGQAMVLATATPAGRPSARAVVLRGFDARGAVFFTDEGSRKALELAANPQASAVLLWPPQRRQARLEGAVVHLPDEEADELFRDRTRSAQLTVWGWRQGASLDRGELERGLAQARLHFTGRPVPRPRYWRGYRLGLEAVELWEERPEGLHERDRFTRSPDGSWVLEQPAP